MSSTETGAWAALEPILSKLFRSQSRLFIPSLSTFNIVRRFPNQLASPQAGHSNPGRSRVTAASGTSLDWNTEPVTCGA